MDRADLLELLDRMIGDRYRLDGLIGRGTLSAVFAGYDTVDGHPVAVKLFAPELASDERFVERLLDAVEQASIVMHPNVASIHDWGVDDHGPYIVSELCEGGSLRAMLDRGHRLSVGQALVVALECARALQFGHDLGFVHRNLKPENLLFAADQRLRVTDFGLTEILAEAPVSIAGRAIESVRYTSPEQARGRPAEQRSDLYTLALVVNEAVTGERPNVAETVVGTLMARAEAAIAADPSLAGLAAVVEWCGRVDAGERPDAQELTTALLAAAETMPRPAGLPLAGLEVVDAAAGPDADAGADVVPLGFDVPRVESRAEPIDEQADDLDPPVDAAWALALDEAGQLDDPEDLPADDDGAAIFDLPRLGAGADTAPETEMGVAAEIVDGSTAGAETDMGSAAETDTDRSDDHATASSDGVVIAPPPDDLGPPADAAGVGIPSDPAGTSIGESAARPALAGLRELAAAEPVFASVPGVADPPAPTLDVPERRASTRDASSRYEEAEDDADDKLPWWPLLVLGLLVAAVIAGAILLRSERSAVASPEVPNVVGLSFDELDAAIAGRGWKVNRLETRINGTEAGEIVAQSPDVGRSLAKGSALTVTVSLGNEMVEIPSDLSGLTVEQAASRLVSVGLALGDVSEEHSEALDAGLIIGTDEPTTQKPAGQGVALRVSLGPTERIVPESVIGMNIAEATEVLTGLRLQAVEEPVYDPSAVEGTVLGAVPAPGEAVAADSQVTLRVSAGPEPVEVPDVEGLALDEAIDAVEALGLVFVDSQGTAGEPAIGTDPPAGEIVDVGTEITIILDEPTDEAQADG